MLLGFLIAAALELLIFIRWPLFGVAVPLTVIMALLVIHLRWLDGYQNLLFLALALFLVDSVASARPGSVYIAGLLATTSGLVISRRLAWPGRFFVPVCLLIYFIGLWSLDGGNLSLEFLKTILISTLVTIALYAVIFQSVKFVERRF